MLSVKSKITRLNLISIWLGVIVCWTSLNPWMVWPSLYINLALIILFTISRMLFIKERIECASLISIITVIFFLFIYCQFFIIPLSSSILLIFRTFIPLIIFLLFSSEEKKLFLKYLINLFSIILILSIIYFFIHMFIELPYVLLKHTNPGYAPFKNYILFVIESDSDFGWFSRFQSIYTEPGQLSMVCSILLYINGYTWKKWQNIIMTIGLIWSFSLAGFALYFIGITLYSICISKYIAKTILKIVVSGGILIGAGMAYYSPTNQDMVSLMILSRLQFDESKGISGNNRNSDVFDYYYENFISSDKRYFGIGGEEFNRKFKGTANSSYKNYVVQNGIIGTLSLFFLMGMLLFCYPSRKGFGLMLLLIASFLQRPYFLWLIESMPYIAAISTFFINITLQGNKRLVNLSSTTQKTSIKAYL